jgi:hypothetical protein
VTLAIIAGAVWGCPRQPDATREVPEPTQQQPTVTTPVPQPTMAATASADADASAAPSSSSAPGGTARWIGDWVGEPCGARKYVRWIHVAAGGVVAGQERVSPCPKGVACVWSGIVEWNGSYTLEGEELVLTVTPPKAGGAAQASLPQRLTWDADTSSPREQLDGETCLYSRRTNAASSPR